MKCEKVQKLMLLQDSGELGAHSERVLEEHILGCDTCRGFKRLLIETKEHVETADGPREKVLQDIKRAARLQTPALKKHNAFYWKPAFATVATVLIGLGLFFSSFRPDSVGLELVLEDTQLLSTEDQAVRVMYNGLSEDDLAFNFLMTYEDNGQG